jgi:hypothetical protein
MLMNKIVLCASDPTCRANYLGNLDLPDNYMCDFSVMGFVVDEYDSAVALLVSQGYQLNHVKGGAEIPIHAADQLLNIRSILAKENINCEYTDIADSLYQA